jgi:hypothetical protein
MRFPIGYLMVSLLVALPACFDDPGPRGGSAGAPEPQQTVSGQGEDGLELVVATAETAPAGEPFDVRVEARDDAGDNRGIEVDFGDGQTWGGLPFDLVCGAVAGETPTEEASDVTEDVTHSYPRAGTYEIVVRTFTGGCFVDHETATVRATVEVVGDTAVTNGPQPPRAKIGHAYYTDGDPSILVSDIGGYDDDGFVSRIEVDWGDGSEPEAFTRPLSQCDEGKGWPTGWFSEPLEHAYEDEGNYEVAVEVLSVGCEGEDAQSDSVTRTLEFPPEQGS